MNPSAPESSPAPRRRPRYGRWALLVLACGMMAAVLAGAIWWRMAEDPRYEVSAWISFGRFSHYDAGIRDAARKHGVDPLLIRAVVWQESRFHADKTGKAGERGLMQVGEMAATDWVRAHKVETFTPTDLFSPGMNLEIGTWYLARALERWKERDDALPFALAHYNAGKRRVDRWIADSGQGEDLGAVAFREQIDFPSTRAYVEAILDRYAYYRRRGWR